MAVLRKSTLLLIPIFLLLTGCQVGYLLKSAYEHTRILRAREPIQEILKDSSVSEDKKRKLRLAEEAKFFAQNELGLKATDNYSSYVDLGRPYVSYVLRVSPEDKLEHHLWWFPVVGSLPYKGYFSEAEALKEAANYPDNEYDTYVRGVSAYSTLGWFEDPILSSMLRYQDEDLVNLIIHETVHATIYIDSNADFNERLAMFIGNRGTELYYLSKEGPDSPTVDKIRRSSRDQERFSDFISREIDALKEWYKAKDGNFTAAEKQARIEEIKVRFKDQLEPQLETDDFKGFKDRTLNNASLLSYQTYFFDLSDFQKLFEILDKDFGRLLEFCKSLEDEDDPESALKEYVKSQQK